MASLAVTIAVALFIAAFIKILVDYLNQIKFCKGYPTPSLPLPIIGHSHLLYNVNREDIVETIIELTKCDTVRRKIATIIGFNPMVWYYHPEPVEEILSSTEMITKSDEYIYLMPWLGTGLLTSTHQKWHSRRKLLTPAFHFRILEDAMDVFNMHGRIFAEVLQEDSMKSEDHILDIFPYVTRCTLDIMLDSAMGQHLGIQQARHSP